MSQMKSLSSHRVVPRDGHFRITNLEGFESFRIRMDSDPLGSGLERFESFWIRVENIRIRPDPVYARFAPPRNVAFRSAVLRYTNDLSYSTLNIQ